MKSFWRRINRRQRLSAIRGVADVWLLLQISLFAAAAPLLMRLRLPRVQRMLRPRRQSASASAHHLLELLDLGLSAVRLICEPTCLTRGLTRCYFLRRAGIDVELAFGMNGTPGLGGHCWLVRDGEPFLESHDPRPAFAEMFRL